MSQLDIYSLDGLVAVVPGGSGGIGSHLSQALARAGASVVVVGRSIERARTVTDAIESKGAQALAVAADVTVREESDRAIAATAERFGRLDIIVNCVGGGAGKVLFPVHEYPDDAWNWIFDLNLTSVLLPTQAAVRVMIKGGRGGRVLNISSVRGQLGIDAGYSAYVAAKGALNALTRQEATEWAKYAITANAISPTFVDTPQVAMLLDDPDFKASLLSRIPLGRVGTPDDLIGAVLFFCSPASSFVTGQILTIDGGLTATQ